MDQVYKGPLRDKEVSTLLVLAYLVESNGTWTIPLGPLQPPFMEFFPGSLPPTVGLMQLASVLVIEGTTSATICTSNQVGDDPGDLPTTSSPLSCASHLSVSSCEGGTLPESPLAGDPSSSPPSVLLLFSPSEMEQQPVRDCGRLFKVAHSLFILMLTDSQFWIGAFIKKW